MCPTILTHALPLVPFAFAPPSSLRISHARAPYPCLHFTPSLPRCVFSPPPPLHVCPRRKLSDPTPLAMCATKRAKTRPSRFPSSSPPFPAPTVFPHPCPGLTPLLRRTSTRTLPYPRAPGHRSSKSKCVHGKSRSDFASRRAHDVAHSPHVPILTRLILQPRPPPCAALDMRPRNVYTSRIRR
jgi:hypothetical protein